MPGLAPAGAKRRGGGITDQKMERPAQEKSERRRSVTDLFSQKDLDPAPSGNSQDRNHGPLMRPDGQYACAVCGAPAHFGFGVKILAGIPGRWSCQAHREAVKNASPR
jgi:hypothetical protein